MLRSNAAWEAFLAGKDGLIHSPTGSGKTLAAIVGPLLERLAEPESSEDTDPIRVIWITPLRALASDTAAALREAVEALGVPFSVALRTGDTSSAEKTKAPQETALHFGHDPGVPDVVADPPRSAGAIQRPSRCGV